MTILKKQTDNWKNNIVTIKESSKISFYENTNNKIQHKHKKYIFLKTDIINY